MPKPNKKTWYSIKNASSNETVIDIYDEIGLWGITAQQFRDDLRDVKSGTIKLHIDSPGGSVFDGVSIYNSLREHPAKIHVRVDALAASIASVIAMAGETVEIHETAFMMVHDPWTWTAGNSRDLREQADLLDDLKENSIKLAYKRKMGDLYDEAAIDTLLEGESWLNAKKSVEYGFADKIIEEGGGAVENSARPLQWHRGIDAYNFKKLPREIMNLCRKKRSGAHTVDYSNIENTLLMNMNLITNL